MFIDTHCHLDFPEFDSDRKSVIQRARDCGVNYIINIGSSIESSKRSCELSCEYDFIYATVGCHPHEADRATKEDRGFIEELAKNQKVIAIGEIGLDYYRNYSLAENQKLLFTSLLKIAKDCNLPVVVHSRNSAPDTLKILKEMLPLQVAVHCFSGDEIFLKECLNLGFFISFTCNITYKKAQNLRELVKLTPLDRLLLETDAPFLPPEGLRGRRNEPANVKFLAEEISRLKRISVEEIAKITSQNAKTFFKLK